jgi:DNA repair exonuclease SbcCD nuclease subunit
MLRLLQTSDVHLGARHPILGERAALQRERQFAAFEHAVELALATPVDLVLIAGDLFDTAVEPRKSVERVATALKRLVGAGIRTVIIPGDHDAAGSASIYRAHDLIALAGADPGGDFVTVLTTEHPDVEIPALSARVTARYPATGLPEDGWRIGLVHQVQRPRDDEIAGAGVDYLGIGGPHTAAAGRAGTVTWGVSGAPELADVERDEAGEVLLITLDDATAHPTVERRAIGRTRFERVELDMATLQSQAVLTEQLAARADPDLVLDVRLTGPWPDHLELDEAAVEAALADRFLQVRVRNRATPPLTVGPLPPRGTITGEFIADLEGRIVELEAAGQSAPAAELREALRVGRRLLFRPEAVR